MRKAIVSVDIGATRTRIGIFDYKNMKLLEKKEFITKTSRDEKIIDKIIQEIKGIINRTDDLELVAVGVGTIGPLDLKKGMVVSSPNIEEKTFEIKEPIERSLNAPVLVANDCVAAVYGELIGGYGRGKRNVVYITLSTGIGAGAIVDGRIILGKDGNAHEVGHLVLSYSSDVKCGCGGIGHWEGLASGKNVWKIIEKIKKDYVEESELKNKKEPSSEELFFLWKKGDTLAKLVIDELAKINAAGIGSVINVFDPEILVLGGSIALRNPGFLDMVLEKVPNYTINRLPEFHLAYYGEDSVLIGAAWIARKPPKELLEYSDLL